MRFYRRWLLKIIELLEKWYYRKMHVTLNYKGNKIHRFTDNDNPDVEDFLDVPTHVINQNLKVGSKYTVNLNKKKPKFKELPVKIDPVKLAKSIRKFEKKFPDGSY